MGLVAALPTKTTTTTTATARPRPAPFFRLRSKRARQSPSHRQCSTVDAAQVQVAQRRTNPGNNLHVSPLVPSLTSHTLEGIFSRVGRVSNCEVVQDPHTRESRGFAFVTMDSPEEADAAIAALNGTVLEGVVLRVTKARRGRARTPTPGTYRGPPKTDRRRSRTRSRSRSPARRRSRSPAYHREYRPRPYDSRYRDRVRDDYYDRDRDRGSRYDERRREGRDYRDTRGYDQERKRDDRRGWGGRY
uniref:RRM domain-containing protein n=1 Tax=Mycena chlorophos TaxID=658473 RepID=A0ABQ0LCW0_MYCCL|nr:predicted protein [Mycena chlorophos]